ncbi:MAG: GNAT family N-acetyltransferase [Acidobacteriota bacterium]
MNSLQIETARLHMRPFTLSDTDDLHRLWIDREVRKYLWDDEVISREVAQEVVRSSVANFEHHGFGLWSVFFKGESALIGFCGFRHFEDPPQIEILYGIAPRHWGAGLATEAARAMIRFGFEENGFERIYAGADPPNRASFRVMERCGMKFEKRMTINDKEAIYYVLSREDFFADDAPYSVLRAPLG